MKRRQFLSGTAAGGLAVAGGLGRGAHGQAPQSAAEREELIERYFAAREAAMDEFPFEKTVASGDQALAALETLKRPGVTPVIVGGEEKLYHVFEVWSMGGDAPDSGSVDDIIRRAEALDYPGALSTRIVEDYKAMIAAYETQPTADNPQASYRAELLDRLRSELAEMEATGVPMPELGVWPEATAQGEAGPFSIYDLATGEVLPQVTILQIPTDDWTTVPAHLRMGGWNECPPPEYHVAAFRSWRERYGAELVAATHDIVELRVSRRPATREEALALAEEFYLYCNDTIDQGFGALAPLAAHLMVSDWWFFWWD